MILGTFGIFSGGELTKNALSTSIDIAPTTLRTEDGRNVGFGQGGRRIQVRFNRPTFEWLSTRPSDLDAPIYALELDGQAGFAYIAFDAESTNDIIVIPAPQTNYVVFAKVSWPVDAASLDDLTLTYVERQESRLLTSPNPIQPGDLYYSGMDFSDVSFNAPLMGFGVLAEVLQAELKARSPEGFKVVLITRDHIEGLGQALTVAPFRVARRHEVLGRDTFAIVDTRVAAAFTYDVTILVGSRIFIWVDPDTGAVGSGTSYTESLGFMVAYADVPVGAAGLQDLRWILASEISQSFAQAGAEIELFRDALPSGFAAPLVVTPSVLLPNALDLQDAIAIINGVQFSAPSQTLTLPEAPLLGDRLDLVFLEAYRVIEATPPADGSFFVPLADEGFLTTKTRLVVAAGATRALSDEAMLDGQVQSIGGGAYVRHPLGHFVSPYSSSYDGESWAIPVAYAYRFNRDPWSLGNLTGGGLGPLSVPSRPDAKRHDFMHSDEVEVLAPVLSLTGLNHQAIFGQTLDMILKAEHRSMFGQSSLVPTYFSKKPVQVDTVDGTPTPGVRTLSAPDQFRRQWSAAPVPYWVGTGFTPNLDKTNELITYEDGSRTLTLKSPDGGALYTGILGTQPVAELAWVETGLPVAIAGSWNLGIDAQAASCVLDDTAPGFDPLGDISLSFEVVQDSTDYLTRPASRMLLALIDGVAIVHADATEVLRLETTPGNLLATVTAIGDPKKADALVVELTLTADGTNVLLVPEVIEGREVLGVIDASLALGGGLAIKTYRREVVNHELELTAALAAGVLVTIHVALGGKILNHAPRRLEIGEMAESRVAETVIAGGEAIYRFALPSNRVMLGCFSFVRTPATPAVHGVYLNNRLYPAVVTGFNRNLVEVSLTLAQAEYLALPLGDQADWAYHVGSDTYRLTPGAYSLKLGILWSDPLTAVQDLALVYQHAALPFLPVSGGEVFELLARGLLLSSNSSVANEQASYTAPVAEKFPVVAGMRIGPAAGPTTSLLDVQNVPQLGQWPHDGIHFEVDGGIEFQAGVGTPGAGFVTWLALVKVNRHLRLLAYVETGATFPVDNDDKAFLSYPLSQFVE